MRITTSPDQLQTLQNNHNTEVVFTGYYFGYISRNQIKSCFPEANKAFHYICDPSSQLHTDTVRASCAALPAHVFTVHG